MKYLLSIIAVLVLSACTGGGLLKGSGEEVLPPYGYRELCKDKPDFEACKP